MNDKNKKVKDIFDELKTELKEFEDSIKQYETYSNNLKEILEITNEIESSWSGSWLGYHAILYYKNFQFPHINERFDVEWGLTHRNQPGWESKSYNDIVLYINQRYNGPTLKIIESSLNNIQVIVYLIKYVQIYLSLEVLINLKMKWKFLIK